MSLHSSHTSSPAPLRATVTAWVGSANLGDELVFSALAKQLTKLGLDVQPLSIEPSATAATHLVSARRRVSAATVRTEMMVLGGGGLIQDETSTLNLDLHLTPVVAARLRREPVAGVGLGAGPLGTRTGRLRVRAALARVPLAVRDATSADVIEGLGLPRPTLAADLTLSLAPVVVEPLDRIAVCLRPWSGRRHRIPARFRRHRSDDRFVSGAARSLDELSKATGLPVHLVAFDAPKDGPLHEAVADRMSRPPTLAVPDLGGVLTEVAASRLVVSMRYHGGMAAVLGGRPAVLVGYSAKVDSLAEDLGPGAVGHPWSADGLGDLVQPAQKVLDRDQDVVEARARLAARERGNGQVLEELIERARAGRRKPGAGS
jgi:polysaccharide pyruvyl transferase CsaB